MTAIPALELGGTHASAALIDIGTGQPRIVDGRLHRLALDSQASAACVLDVVVECAALLGVEESARWAIAVPGPFDYDTGIARHHGVGKFDSLAGVDVGAVLRGRITPRPDAVRFLNDAHAFTVGEWHTGAGTGRERMVGLTLGTGVGSGFLCDGAIVDSGPTVPPEGRIDLTFIDGRPLEEVVSRRAVLREFGNIDGIDVRDIADQARIGRPTAISLFRTVFHQLGAAVGPWLDRFRAEAVVVGGSMVGAWDLIAGPFTAGLGTTADRVKVNTATLGDSAALIGAAAHLYAG